MDGELVELVTLADLGCETMDDLRELCAGVERPAWAGWPVDEWPFDDDPPDPL